MIEATPCPICGGTPSMSYVHPPIPLREADWEVVCDDCVGDYEGHAPISGCGRTADAATQSWNDEVRYWREENEE